MTHPEVGGIIEVTVQGTGKELKKTPKGQEAVNCKVGEKDWICVLGTTDRNGLFRKKIKVKYLGSFPDGNYTSHAYELVEIIGGSGGGGYRGGGRPAPVAQEWRGMEQCASAAVDLARGFWKEDTEAQRTFVNTVVMAYCRGELKAPGAVMDEDVGPEWGERRDTEGVPF